MAETNGTSVARSVVAAVGRNAGAVIISGREMRRIRKDGLPPHNPRSDHGLLRQRQRVTYQALQRRVSPQDETALRRSQGPNSCAPTRRYVKIRGAWSRLGVPDAGTAGPVASPVSLRNRAPAFLPHRPISLKILTSTSVPSEGGRKRSPRCSFCRYQGALWSW